MPTSAAFVAVAGDRAVGTVQLHEFEIDAIRDRSRWVCGMVVRPEYRNAKVGHRLVAALEQFVAAFGVGWARSRARCPARILTGRSVRARLGGRRQV